MRISERNFDLLAASGQLNASRPKAKVLQDKSALDVKERKDKSQFLN